MSTCKLRIVLWPPGILGHDIKPDSVHTDVHQLEAARRRRVANQEPETKEEAKDNGDGKSTMT